MKYKIIKKESKSLNVKNDSNGNDVVSVSSHLWYEAKRKGTIFGFWHTIGHDYDWYGDIWPHITKTPEAMEDYIRKWHEVRYNNTKIEIVKDIDL